MNPIVGFADNHWRNSADTSAAADEFRYGRTERLVAAHPSAARIRILPTGFYRLQPAALVILSHPIGKLTYIWRSMFDDL